MGQPMGRHRGVYAQRFIRMSYANELNRANRERREMLLAELTFNDELWKTYSSGGFSIPSTNPFREYWMKHDVDMYFKLSRRWHG